MASPLQLKFEFNLDDFGLVLPPSGKSDRHIPCTPANFHARPRVKKGAQKGGQCFLYALDGLRSYIGKHPSAEFLVGRNVEVILSKRKKTFFQAQVKIKQFLHSLLKYGVQSQDEVRHLLANKHASPEYKEATPEFDAFLQEFCRQSQTDDIEKFAPMALHQARYQANLACLRSFNIDLQAFYTEHFVRSSRYSPFEKTLCQFIDWELLSEEQKFVFTDKIVCIVSYQKLGFRESTWRPTQPIDDLIRVIKQCGPQIGVGFLGSGFYDQAPKLSTQKQIKHPVYYWEPNSKIKTERVFHAVIIVGARKMQKQEVVYFYDPSDESDPDNPNQRPLYVMSYERLCADCANLDSFNIFQKSTQKPYHFPGTAYSIYNPSLIMTHDQFSDMPIRE